VVCSSGENGRLGGCLLGKALHGWHQLLLAGSSLAGSWFLDSVDPDDAVAEFCLIQSLFLSFALPRRLQLLTNPRSTAVYVAVYMYVP
jgi:hypothetical protein